MNSKIKAICFDLDGVYFTPKGKNSFREGLINEYGVSREIVDDLMYRSPEMAKLVRGQITSEDFWNRFREITGITATDKELANRWVRDYEVNTEVKKVVESAKEKGYKTCVCTNNNGIRLPILIERFKLSDYFDCIISSHEVGFTKPNKEIFEALLNCVGVQPSELVYSDDNPERLHGARDLGIQTFEYKSFEQFVDELNRLGVII